MALLYQLSSLGPSAAQRSQRLMRWNNPPGKRSTKRMFGELGRLGNREHTKPDVAPVPVTFCWLSLLPRSPVVTLTNERLYTRTGVDSCLQGGRRNLREPGVKSTCRLPPARDYSVAGGNVGRSIAQEPASPASSSG